MNNSKKIKVLSVQTKEQQREELVKKAKQEQQLINEICSCQTLQALQESINKYKQLIDTNNDDITKAKNQLIKDHIDKVYNNEPETYKQKRLIEFKSIMMRYFLYKKKFMTLENIIKYIKYCDEEQAKKKQQLIEDHIKNCYTNTTEESKKKTSDTIKTAMCNKYNKTYDCLTYTEVKQYITPEYPFQFVQTQTKTEKCSQNSIEKQKNIPEADQKCQALKIVDFVSQKSPKLRYEQFKKEIMKQYSKKDWEEVSLEEINRFFNFHYKCVDLNSKEVIKEIKTLPLMYATLLKTKDLSEIEIKQEDHDEHKMIVITNKKNGNRLFQKKEENINESKLQEIKHSYPMEFLYVDDIFLSTEANRKENKKYYDAYKSVKDDKDCVKRKYLCIEKNIKKEIESLYNKINDNNVSALAYYLIDSCLTRKLDWSLFRTDNIAISNKLNMNCLDYAVNIDSSNYKLGSYNIDKEEVEKQVNGKEYPYCYKQKQNIYYLSQKDQFNKLFIALYMADSLNDNIIWMPAHYQIIKDILLDGVFKENEKRKEFLTAVKKILLDKAVMYFRRLLTIEKDSEYCKNEKIEYGYRYNIMRTETLYELSILSGMLELTCDTIDDKNYKNEKDKDVDEQIQLLKNTLIQKVYRNIKRNIKDIEEIKYGNKYNMSDSIRQHNIQGCLNNIHDDILHQLTFEEPIKSVERKKRLQKPLESIAITRTKGDYDENKIFIPYKLVDNNGITVRNTQASSTFTMKEKYNDYIIKEIEKEIETVNANINTINKILNNERDTNNNKLLEIYKKQLKIQSSKLQDNIKKLNHQYDKINKISKSNSDEITTKVNDCIQRIQNTIYQQKEQHLNNVIKNIEQEINTVNTNINKINEILNDKNTLIKHEDELENCRKKLKEHYPKLQANIQKLHYLSGKKNINNTEINKYIEDIQQKIKTAKVYIYNLRNIQIRKNAYCVIGYDLTQSQW